MYKSIQNHTVIAIAAFALFIGFWEMMSDSSGVMRFILPPPSRIAITIWEHADRLSTHTLATFYEMIGGFILALVVAFPLAWLMSLFGPLRALFQPMFVAIQCIPIFALAPLMVLWFGWSYFAIVVPTALMIFFPLTMSIYQGLCATPKHLLDFFKTHQATVWQTFFKLQLPWALPHIFSGFRIAVAIAGIGAIAGEWAGAQQGLGLLMLESRRGADVEMMFAALVCVTAVSLFLYGLTVLSQNMVEKRRELRFPVGKAMLGILMASLLLSGCQQSQDKSKQTTLILDWLPNPNHVAIYVGIENGFFAAQGIDLIILKITDPSDGIPYLVSRQVDLCLTYMPNTIQAMTKGAKVVPMGILIEQPLNALIFRKNAGIKKPEDLNGKTIGYCVDGYHTAFLEAMFIDKGIVPSKLQNVNFDLVTTLGAGQVDALYGAYWNIECENLRLWGVETDYFPLSEFGVPLYPELIFLARADSPQVVPKYIDDFQAALQRSIDFSVENPDLAFSIYLKANPDKSSKTRQWEKEAWYKTIPTLAKNQTIDSDVWDNFVSWLVARDLLP